MYFAGRPLTRAHRSDSLADLHALANPVTNFVLPIVENPLAANNLQTTC
jgi:hypothetical protein